jgi:hypothetical protein
MAPVTARQKDARRRPADSDNKRRWVLLMPALPSADTTARVKIWRQLQKVGAVALKNSVYVLPNRDECIESFEWVARELIALGGQASLCEGQFFDGATDGDIERRFVEARSADYEEIGEIRKKTPKPGHSSGAAPLPAKSNIDAAKVEAALGMKGQVKDGMFKGAMGRNATASCGCNVGKTMGVNTWAAFAGNDENAVVDGDFAVAESELQPVLKALPAGGINIVAIHHHMSGETPRILFLHYWGRGKATDLAATVKKALDLTAWDKPKAEAT